MYRIETSTLAGATVVSASGELDAYAAPELASVLNDGGPDQRLVVDLGRVTFLDSTALGTLNRAVRRVREQGRDIPLVLPRGPARRIFEITGLDRALSVYDSLEEAVRL